MQQQEKNKYKTGSCIFWIKHPVMKLKAAWLLFSTKNT
jgi:hypothetical protein